MDDRKRDAIWLFFAAIDAAHHVAVETGNGRVEVTENVLRQEAIYLPLAISVLCSRAQETIQH